jgi:hypothetical protein
VSPRDALLVLSCSLRRHGDCLRWAGPESELERVRRILYELARGPIPAGRELRRRAVCHTAGCVSPRHATISRRRRNGSDLAPYGHRLSVDGWYAVGSSRVCRPCTRLRRNLYREQKRRLAAAA